MQFWRLTPRELYREFRIARQRMLEDRERQLMQAWETAALTASAMAGKLPKLDKLLMEIRPKPKRLSLADISRTLGMPMRPASPEALAALERLEANLG